MGECPPWWVIKYHSPSTLIHANNQQNMFHASGQNKGLLLFTLGKILDMCRILCPINFIINNNNNNNNNNTQAAWSIPVQSDVPWQKMFDHQNTSRALSPCHEQVGIFQMQSGIYELLVIKNNRWSTHTDISSITLHSIHTAITQFLNTMNHCSSLTSNSQCSKAENNHMRLLVAHGWQTVAEWTTSH